MSQTASWALRTARNNDIGFLFNSWLKSFRDAPSMVAVNNTVYYDHFHKVLESVFTKSAIVVACDVEDPDTVFGYAVGEVRDGVLIIHWVYVKHPLRGHGLGKALEDALLAIPHNSVAYSCRTRLSDSFNKTRNYTYNPFYLWSHA